MELLFLAKSGSSHSDKTFIGRMDRGFDFLGYRFGLEGLSVAARTIERFIARAIRLSEQEPGKPIGSSRLALYVKRWLAMVVVLGVW